MLTQLLPWLAGNSSTTQCARRRSSWLHDGATPLSEARRDVRNNDGRRRVCSGMARERMYPMLPCRDIDEAIAFYAALRFKKTYRQVRPNPYAVVAREDMHVHLFGIDGFDPAQSYGSVGIQVPDPDELYRS